MIVSDNEIDWYSMKDKRDRDWLTTYNLIWT